MGWYTKAVTHFYNYMAFFGLFGSSNRYSTHEHYLPEEAIRHIVSFTKIHTLKVSEEKQVQETIKHRRHGDGKISLQQIYEVLRVMEREHRISEFDRKGIMKLMQEYFDEQASKVWKKS